MLFVVCFEDASNLLGNDKHVVFVVEFWVATWYCMEPHFIAAIGMLQAVFKQFLSMQFKNNCELLAFEKHSANILNMLKPLKTPEL